MIYKKRKKIKNILILWILTYAVLSFLFFFLSESTLEILNQSVDRYLPFLSESSNTVDPFWVSLAISAWVSMIYLCILMLIHLNQLMILKILSHILIFFQFTNLVLFFTLFILSDYQGLCFLFLSLNALMCLITYSIKLDIKKEILFSS